MKMTSREQQQRAWEMEFSLSHTNPLFNQPSSPKPSPSSSCHCRRWSLSELQDTGTFAKKASSSFPQHKENWSSEHHENSKCNDDLYSSSSHCISKPSETPLKQRVLSERPELLNSAVMIELECSKTVMDSMEEEHRDLSPEISKAELLRIKRLLENRLQASPRTEEKATKALCHLKSAPFTSSSPQSARGKRRRSTGHIAGELLRTHGCSGRNKSTDPRPYDPKQNFLSPRPQFLRYRPNRRLDLLQRSADSEAYAALKAGDLNQAGNEGIAAELVKVENLEDNGVVPESCNSSFIVVGASDHIEVGMENISAEEDRHIQELANIPQSEGLGNREPGATEAIVKNATPQSWELANRAPGGTEAVNENATPGSGELGNRVPGATEAISENVTKENNTDIQEPILPQSEELGNGVPGTMEAITENVTKEDNTGSHEATLQQSEVKDEADTACPKGLLLPPDAKTKTEAIKEYLEKNETNVEDPVGAPTMEVTYRKTVTNLSVQKAKLKMVVRFLAVIFLLAVCMVGVTFLAWSSSSDPVRTNHAKFFVQPWQNLSASKPSTDFLDINLLPGTEDKESLEVKAGKLGNLEVLTGVPSQLLVDDYKWYGSSLPDSFAPNVISERSEPAFVEPLPLRPTSLSAMEATGCFQQVQGGMDEPVDLVDLAKPLMEEYMMKDEAAADIISNDIEYDIDAGLSTEPEDRNQEDTECPMPVGRIATVMREDALADALPTVPNPGNHVQSPEEEMSLEQTLTESQKESVQDNESIVGNTINPFMSLGDFEGGMCSLPSVHQSQLSKFPEFILVGIAATAAAITLAITLRFMKSHNKSMIATYTRKLTKAEQVMCDAPQPPSTPVFKHKSTTETRSMADSPHQPTITIALKPNTENLMSIYDHKRTSKSSGWSSPRRAVAQPVLRATATNSTPQAHLLRTSVRSAPKGYFSPTSHTTPVTSYTPSASSSYMPSESTTSTVSGSRETWSVADSELSALLDDSQLGSFTAYEPILSSEGLEMERLKLTPVRRSLRIRNQVASPLAARKVTF